MAEPRAVAADESPARRRVSGWLVAACIVTFLVALAAGATLVWANREADAATAHRAHVQAALASGTSGAAADRLAAARATVASVRAQLDAIPAELTQVADLEQRDSALVQAAFDAGKKGDVPAYNEAVTKRNALAPQVDAAVEKLRTDVNAVLAALATITNRTAP